MNPEQAPLITAVPGPYKIAPADPKGLQVDGEDQTIYAAGEGIDPGSVIDTNAVPETPLPRPGTQAPLPPGPPTDLLSGTAPSAAPPNPLAEPAKPTAKPPVSDAKPVAPAPAAVAKPAPTAAKPSGTVQLGAFSTPEKAEEAWAKLSARHGLTGKRVIATTANGKTLYRLRSSGDANAICARMKAAGDACAIVE
jgi:cell division protein FtsN